MKKIQFYFELNGHRIEANKDLTMAQVLDLMNEFNGLKLKYEII